MEILKRTVIMQDDKVLVYCFTWSDMNYPDAWSDPEIDALVGQYRRAGRLVTTETIDLKYFG